MAPRPLIGNKAYRVWIMEVQWVEEPTIDNRL